MMDSEVAIKSSTTANRPLESTYPTDKPKRHLETRITLKDDIAISIIYNLFDDMVIGIGNGSRGGAVFCLFSLILVFR